MPRSRQTKPARLTRPARLMYIGPLCADQFWSSTSPSGQPPGHLNFWRLACSNSLPSGQESCSNARPISNELPLLKDKFGLQSSTLHAFQREICRNDTFNLLLKTLFKDLFTNKGEILSCISVRPRKNRKNSRAYYVRTRGKSGSNSPPFQRNVQIPPSPGTMHSQMPGVCPGGMLKFRIDRRITPQIPMSPSSFFWSVNFHWQRKFCRHILHKTFCFFFGKKRFYWWDADISIWGTVFSFSHVTTNTADLMFGSSCFLRPNTIPVFTPR